MCRVMFFLQRLSYVAAAWTSLAAAAAAQAQTVSLKGRVVDGSGLGLPSVTIEVVGTFWQTTTKSDGSFDIKLPTRSWTLRARQLGFAPESVTVTALPDLITIRLRATPIALKGITVRGERTSPLAQTVSASTVRQVPPLAEPDVFRAVVMLPNVSQPNDLKGRIHLAGGSSDETGVQLDGHPLQDPFHLLGVLGAFNVAALDRAQVLIHHLPIENDGRLSGVITLKSRRSAAAQREAVVGLLSTGLTVAEPEIFHGFNVLVSGRITYLDRLIGALGDRATIDGEDPTLLGYRDGLLRVDRSWANTQVEGIHFNTRDWRASGGTASRSYNWGESLSGLSSVTRAGAWTVRSRVSYNHATADLAGIASASPGFDQRVDLEHDWLSGEIAATRLARTWSSQFGITVDAQSNLQEWTGSPEGFFSPRTPRQFSGSQSHTRTGLFGEASVSVAPGVTATIGTRVVRLEDRTFAAPRALLMAGLPGDVKLSLSLGRRYQFSTELEEPSEGSGKQPLFLLSKPRQADVAAVSLERSSGRIGEFQITAFGKRYRNRTRLRGNPRAFTDSTGGQLPDFPEFDRVPGRGYGVAGSMRREFGARSLIQASYTFQRITELTGGRYVPTAWDSPHALNIFGTTSLSRYWSLNIAAQWRSGAATTPVAARVFAPGTGRSPFLSPFLDSRYINGNLNSDNLSAYRRIDVGVRREWKRGKTEIAFAAQALNILSRPNSLETDWASFYCVQSGECKEVKPARRGLPIIPSFGIEVKW